MEKSASEEPEERNVVSSSKKTRRSVVRSFSWKRSKKTKMEEVNQEPSLDVSYEVDGDERRFEKGVGSQEVCDVDEEEEEVSDLDQSGPVSKKRKRFGMWKTMKRMFNKKSSKGSKSFTDGESTSPTLLPHKSISDPNLASRTNPPELAPLEQVNDSTVHAEASTSPKRASSHGNLISELRSIHRNSTEKEKATSLSNEEIPTSSPKTRGINWTDSPSYELVPGLNVSHDKIKVAPRHRRAPTRKGVASVRHHDRVDGDVIPRSNSVGVNSASFPSKKQKETVNFDELIQSLRPRENENATSENKKENIEVNMREEPSSEQGNATGEMERDASMSDEKIHESTEHDMIEKGSDVNTDPGLNELQENTNEDETSTMEITSAVLKFATPAEVKREICEERDQQSTEEALQESKFSDDDSTVPLSTCIASTEHDDANTSVDFPVSLSKTASTSVTDHDSELMYEDAFGDNADAGISPVTIVESVSVTNDKPTCEGDTEALHVELIEPVTKPVSECISETYKEGSVEAVVINERPAIEILPSPGSEPVALELPVSDKADDRFILKVESKQKANRSSSSDEHSEPSSTIKDVIIVESMESASVEAPVTSPVRSRRLNIETPENVFQKAIIPELVIHENEDKDHPEPKGIQRRRPQSLYTPKSTNALEEKGHSKDDSNAGVARLTKAFELTSRSNTISLGERRKKPIVLPKPKYLSQTSVETVQTPNETKTRSLGRNFRISATTEKSNEKSLKKDIITNANHDTVVIIDQSVFDENKMNEKVTVKNLPKKPERRGTAPKPLPKPKIYKESTPAVNANVNDLTVLNDEGKENIEGDSVPKLIKNGSTKILEKESLIDKKNITIENKDGQSDNVMPSFWAKRTRFNSEKNTTTNSQGSSEKPTTKEVTKPLIQLKTETCVVCGSKVYQMEKCKVKDNIVHKSCIKCYACKRLLSVGNLIMSQNKIYCKLHEPSRTVALST